MANASLSALNAQNTDLFKEYPLVAVQIVERAIVEVIAERTLYPFKPTQIVRTKEGFHVW